ncbi:hypothetical protein [Francisella sp. XLW-1]|uniref:hypothetical protein n=1 Tax=Francisella sp. XLW-1 TaxID=2610887 RepID=UPI001CD12655|nr:hypothetical protein [Francisella sp. XLW-1]
MEHVQEETFGRKLNGQKDALIGYTLSKVKIKNESVIKVSGTDVHPILKFTGNASDIVEGTVYEVTLSELN